jgi:hypothetical protein
LLTTKFLSNVHEVETITLEPLPGYDEKKLKGKWFYENTNPLPTNIPAIDATFYLPHVVKKDKEIIIRDKNSGKVILAVYRN